MSGHGSSRRRSRRGGGDHEEHVNHERWLVSYSDMITVLMALFIVLFAISQVDQEKYEALRQSLAQGFQDRTGSDSILDGSAGNLDGESIVPQTNPANGTAGTEAGDLSDLKQSITVVTGSDGKASFAVGLERSTELARKMVCEWGMSDAMGPLTFGKKEEQIFLGREIAQHRDYSESTAIRIDEAVQSIVMTGYDKARAIIEQHRDAMQRIADELLVREVLDADQVRRIIAASIALEEDFGRLVVLLAATGARFSQLARMSVGDVQAEHSRLMIPQSFKGRKRQLQYIRVQVGADTLAALRPVTEGRALSAPLLEH